VEDNGNVEDAIAERCSILESKLKCIDCIVPMGCRVTGAVATNTQAGQFPPRPWRRP
jgi:hypothetical protein